MSFWDEVRKGLEEGAHAIKKGAEVVAEKTEEAAKIAKLRYNIYTVRQGIKKDFTKLGAHLFELAEQGKPAVWKDEQVLAIIEQVRDSRTRIEELEAEVEAVSVRVETQSDVKESQAVDSPGAATSEPVEEEPHQKSQ